MKSRWGIFGWYGQNITECNSNQLSRFAAKSQATIKAAEMPCPFKRNFNGSEKLCSKPGGICSIALYQLNGDNVEIFGDRVAVCPSYLWDLDVFREIGKALLGINNPILVKEEKFIGGRFDLVLVDPDRRENWCVAELQSVYTSGGDTINGICSQFLEPKKTLPWPKTRISPDWRSSSFKRLMPQLDVKVKTLRTWGKKMAVVIDNGFYQSLGPMRKEEDVSNSDVIWFVVKYLDKKVILDLIVKTRLESAIEALINSASYSRQKFEDQFGSTIQAEDISTIRNKTFRLPPL